MNSFLQQLLTLLQGLEPASGTSSQAVDDVLRAFAASQILLNPANAVLPPGDLDPRIVQAVQAGALQATALKAAGKQLRVLPENLPFGTAAADLAESRAELFGPFIETSGRLMRFFTIESPHFLTVNFRAANPLLAGELLLLLPAASTPVAPDTLHWTLPQGTVWMQSKFLVAGSPNFAGVRIASGVLTFDRPVVRHGAILVGAGTNWTLALDLEQPAAAAGGASDADALNLHLPAQLVVSSNAPPVLKGDASISGFGSDLTLSPAGAPSLDGNQISLPMQIAEPSWTIGGNASRLAQFSATSAPGNARWAVPMTITPPAQLGEAATAGSIVFSVGTGLTSTFAAQNGNPSRWFVATVTANANQIEVQSVQPTSGARYDLNLWGTSLTKLRFAGQPITRLIFRSERGGFDTLAVVGGSCSDAWDLPKQADGQPFAFDGTINVFGLVSATSSLLVTLVATAPITTPNAGFALENLYLLVRGPRRLTMAGAFDPAPSLPSGRAVLSFDVLSALPTLPDPYAANLELSNGDVPIANALRVAMSWTDGKSPTIVAHLDTAVPFPEPRFNLLDDQDERTVYNSFREHIQSQIEFLYLLDLSSREHLFGVALESPSDHKPDIVDNRLSVQLNRVRLLMQPQVQWEPVRIEGNPNVLGLVDGFGHSNLNGGPTLVGSQSVKLVPTLPGLLSQEIVAAVHSGSPAAALFSLPFGLRAMARLDQIKRVPGGDPSPPATATLLNQPAFGDLDSARQLRLIALNRGIGPPEPSRVMPGVMQQLANLSGNASGLRSVVPNDLRDNLNAAFANGVPLHQVDLSGYGLSTFSEWSQDVEGAGFSKVEFRAMNGRTSYEVIQFRSILYECGARTVRTVILERHNSGRVFRTDTGWVAIDAGQFKRPDAFQKGAVLSFQNIRRIRIVGPVMVLAAGFEVEPVIFDADAAIDGANDALVPMYDRPGYVQIKPLDPAAPGLVPPQPIGVVQRQLLALLYARVKAISSPIDCVVRVGKTLEAQISSIASDLALDDGGGVGFAVAVVGAPKLPRAGQWTVVCIDPNTQETSPTDQRRGVPLVRDGAKPFRFRDPSDTRRSQPRTDYALMMATDTSRALFQRPFIDPNAPGKMQFDVPALLADPYSLVQSTGAFPRPNFGLRLKEIASFDISSDNLWKIENDAFTIAAAPLTDFVKGSGWDVNRAYDGAKITLGIDSAVPAAFNIAIPPSILKLDLPAPLGEVIHIRNTYKSVAGELSKLADPELLFMGALDELTKLLDSLSALIGLPFHFDVSVTAGSGASPSFIVHMHLLFRIGDGPDGRVEIGLGKFYGQFLVDGDLEVSLKGVDHALLFIEFQGDVQQGILPPLLYAGGLIRFSVELHETGGPTIQLTLGIVISIGGDLIPGLLAVEATIKYGYSLIPETLQPGILLGLEARAKLLAGLIGFSFSVEAMARIKRKDLALVTVWAQIRVAASVQIAIFFEEDVDFQTQFQQDVPLAALALVPGAGLAVFAAEVPL